MSETEGDWTGNPEASAGEESSFDRDLSCVCKRVWYGGGVGIELNHEEEVRGEEADEGGARGSSGWRTRAPP